MSRLGRAGGLQVVVVLPCVCVGECGGWVSTASSSWESSFLGLGKEN